MPHLQLNNGITVEEALSNYVQMVCHISRQKVFDFNESNSEKFTFEVC